MTNFITILCLIGLLAFPTFMQLLTYPFGKKSALFWANYISNHSSVLLLSIMKTYKKFRFLADNESKKQLPEQFLVISNHQSLLDIVVYLVFFHEHKVRFVAKDTLGKTPMVGKMLKTQGHCMIPRKGKPIFAMRYIADFGNRVMERHQIPVIFPEGTRSRDGNLGQFFPAGFRRLNQTVNLPVAVCALDGGYRISKLGDFFKNLKNGFYKVKVLKVYPAPKTKEDELKILEEGKELIQAQLDLWRSEEK